MSEIDKYRGIAHIFTSKNFTKAVLDNNLEPITNRILRHSKELGLGEEYTIKQGIEASFQILAKNYPNEFFYKTTFFNKYILGKYSPKTASFFSEFRIGGSIADVLIINGIGTVYEIKSELDTPKRLKQQIRNYYKVIPFVNIIISESEVEKYFSILPQSCGVLVRTKRNTLKSIREANKEIAFITPKEIFKCFRKEEYVSIVKTFISEIDSIPNTRISVSYTHLTLPTTPYV